MEFENNYLITNHVPSIADVPIINNVSTVYHYTSVEGLKSIFSQETLRFTDVAFMNDSSEVLDGWGYINAYLSNLGYTQFPAPPNTHIFAVCFSFGNDELPLWNYYSKNSQNEGYNIEVDYDKLIKSIIKNNIDILMGCGVMYGSVLYDDKAKLQCVEIGSKIFGEDIKLFLCHFIKQTIDSLAENLQKDAKEILENIEESTADITIPDMYQVYKYNNTYDSFDRNIFLESICFSKHKAFSFEREMRIIVDIPEDRYIELCKDGTIRFRTFRGSFIPFIDLKFDLGCIDGINIAPMLKGDIAEKGLSNFLSSKGIGDKMKNGIRKSSIPVRY